MPRAALLQLIVGASYPVRAIFFIFRHGLWPLTLLALAVNVVLLAATCYAALHYALPALANLAASGVQLALSAAGQGGLTARPQVATCVSWVVWVGCLPFVLTGAMLLVLSLGQLVSSPVLDRLSERCEALRLGTVPAPWRLRQAIDAALLAAGDAAWAAWTGLAALAPRLLLAFVPGIGALVLWGWAAGLLAHEFVGLPMTRRLLPYRARWRLLMDNPAPSLGFGAATYVLLLVPGLNLCLLPLACVGGTLLYCDLVRAGLLLVPEPQSHPPAPTQAGKS